MILFLTGFDQVSSLKVFWSYPENTATVLEVSTIFFTPLLSAALNTDSVPSRAGLIISFSCFRLLLGGNGEATCITKSMFFMAGSHESGFSKSASTSSKLVLANRWKVSSFSTFFVSFRDRTVPLTLYPLSKS